MEQQQLEHFMSASYLYFLIHQKDAGNISEVELTELIVAINDMERSGEVAESYLV
ncbi:MAG: hypothetical protein HKN08_07630 [Gammaproteobacteria bacterium]|nr:hypothetical protein [Gammaproteobacteria bacterium]